MSKRAVFARRTVAAMAVVAFAATACGSSSKKSTTGSTAASGSSSSTNKASAPGITATTIKIGFITSVTGDASSSFSTAADGAKAYFDAVNAQGGINGRKIQLVTADDTSSPAGDLTATNYLISQGVFGIVQGSSFAFGGAKAAQQAGVPVTGTGFDGTEWGEQPYTNMFSLTGGIDPNHPELQADIPAVALFKYLGTKNIGALAYGNSPSSIDSIKDLKSAMAGTGITMPYENLSVTFGTTDVTSDVLAMKSAGTDMAVCSCVQSTVLSLVTGLKQAGLTAKSLSFASADSTIFADPSAVAAAQGVYYASSFPPLDTNNAASTTFYNNVKAVEPSLAAGAYPAFGVQAAYFGAQLMVKGLQVAGQNPTRQSFITNLSKVTNFTADGLLAAPVSFNHFGTSQKTYCEYYVKVQGTGFVAVDNGKPFCGSVPAGL